MPVALLFLPLCLCRSSNIQKFENKPGIYFDGIGVTKVTAEWKFITYYDLSPFWADMNDFSAGIRTLQELCKVAAENRSCEMLSENLIQVQKHLEK